MLKNTASREIVKSWERQIRITPVAYQIAVGRLAVDFWSGTPWPPELVGAFQNAGQEWQRSGDPVPVRVHDFLDDVLGKVILYGVYDLAPISVGSASVRTTTHRRL